MSSPTNHSSLVLVKGLHSLPHYNLMFNPVPHDFDYNSQDYYEALAQFAIPWFLFAILALCAWRFFGKGDPEYSPLDEDDERLSKWTTILVVSAAVVILLSPVFYFGNEEIADGVKNFGDRLKSCQGIFNNIMLSVKVSQADITEVIVEMPDGGTLDIIDTLKTANTSLDVVLEFQDSIKDVDAIVDTLATYEEYRWIAMIAFAGLLVVSALLALRARWGCGPGGRSKYCCCGSTMAVISFLFGGIFLAASVAVADFCMDPNRVITELVGTSDSSTLAEAAAYYINCPPGATSPFVGDVENALGDFDYAISLARNLTEVDPAYNDTLYNLIDLKASSDVLLAQTSCDALHQEYIGSLDAVCDNGVTGFVMVMCTLAFSAAGLVMCVIAIRMIKKLFLDDEVSPLVPRKGGGHRRKPQGEFDPLVRETYMGPP
eukprot:m.87386 g.87386  ORF g.87386 m.87386 type:complete len:432 (-) comp26064_c1_seq2:160-1455(-)